MRLILPAHRMAGIGLRSRHPRACTLIGKNNVWCARHMKKCKRQPLCPPASAQLAPDISAVGPKLHTALRSVCSCHVRGTPTNKTDLAPERIQSPNQSRGGAQGYRNARRGQSSRQLAPASPLRLVYPFRLPLLPRAPRERLHFPITLVTWG